MKFPSPLILAGFATLATVTVTGMECWEPGLQKFMLHENLEIRNRGFLFKHGLPLFPEFKVTFFEGHRFLSFSLLIFMTRLTLVVTPSPHHLSKKEKSSAESVVTMYVLYYANLSTFTWQQNYKRRCPNYIRIKKVHFEKKSKK